MVGIIITWLVTAVSFLIISRLPFLGIDVDGFGKAAISAAVFGILNAILLPILTFFTFTFFTFPFIIPTLGLFLFIVIVPGFSLRYGFWSVLLGSISLAIINSILIRLIAPLT